MGNGMPQNFNQMNGMPQNFNQMNGMPQNIHSVNDAPYSPSLNNVNNAYSPQVNINNITNSQMNNRPLTPHGSMYSLTPTGSMQNIEGLNNLPPNMRQHALAGINNVGYQPQPNIRLPQVNNLGDMQQMQYNNLPTMHYIQNQQ